MSHPFHGLDTHGDHEPFIGQDGKPQLTEQQKIAALEHYTEQAALADLTANERALVGEIDNLNDMITDRDKEIRQLRASLTAIQSLVDGVISKAGLR